MDIDNKSADAPPAPANKKKPYVKPSFRYEKVFETTALSCGKTGNSSLQCTLNSKNSGLAL